MDTYKHFTDFTTLKALRVRDNRPTVIDLMREHLSLMSTLSEVAQIEIFVKDRFDLGVDHGYEVVITIRGDLFWSWIITSKILANISQDRFRRTTETQCTKAFEFFLKPFDDYWWETLNETRVNGEPT